MRIIATASRPRRPRRRVVRALALGAPLVAAGAIAGILLASAAPRAAVTVRSTSTITVTDVGSAPSAPAGGRVPVTAAPSEATLAAARAWVRGRAGNVAFAVVDGAGRLRGTRMHERFASASLVKAMLLVAYLRALGADGEALDAGARALLDPMIRASDNDAASAIYERVGEAGLVELARASGMTDFVSHPLWGETGLSAADQARFFALLDQLVPRRFGRFARSLLGGVIADQSWGIPAVARAEGFVVLFKGGWREGIVNQAARLEGRRATLALAVLSDRNPSMGYGIETVAGVAAALFAR